MTREKEPTMCLSCGCGQPMESHGDPNNITMETIQRAADAAGISSDEAARNIRDGLQAQG